jgi:hypothetical protein
MVFSLVGGLFNGGSDLGNGASYCAAFVYAASRVVVGVIFHEWKGGA